MAVSPALEFTNQTYTKIWAVSEDDLEESAANAGLWAVLCRGGCFARSGEKLFSADIFRKDLCCDEFRRDTPLPSATLVVTKQLSFN